MRSVAQVETRQKAIPFVRLLGMPGRRRHNINMDGIALPGHPSTGLTAAFVVLPLTLMAFWIWAVGVGSLTARRHRLLAAGFLSMIAMATWWLGNQPFLHAFATFPPPVLRVFLVCFALTLWIGFSGFGRRIARALPLPLLVGFQAFRLPLELAMARAHSEGIMPVEMSFHGRNFDILTGILAIPLSVWLFKGLRGRAWVWIWNFLGMGLLVNVVANAILLMPGSAASRTSTIPNVWVSYTPFIWLPSLLVTSALLGHILVIRRLCFRAPEGSST